MKLALIILISNINFINAQIPVINWQKCYGGSESDNASCIKQLPNGGYVVCGFSESEDGDIVNHHGFS